MKDMLLRLDVHVFRQKTEMNWELYVQKVMSLSVDTISVPTVENFFCKKLKLLDTFLPTEQFVASN